MFGFVQFEFGVQLGPADGRYLRRPAEGAEPDRVVVVATLGAPQRRLLGRKRPKELSEAEPEPVPTTRVTLIRTERLADPESWLSALRADREGLEEEAEAALRELNGILRAHRAASLDPYVREVGRDQALVIRVGYGEGEQVADGRFAEAYELPRGRKPKRSVQLAPQERLARIMGGHDPLLVSEELVTRARADLSAGHTREAALQARIAFEALLAEVEPDVGGEPLRAASAERESLAAAANAALDGDVPPELAEAVERAVERMEAALRRRALRRSGAT